MEIGSFILVVCAIILVALLLYIYLKHHFGYWKRRNIPGEEPYLLYGSFKGILRDVGIHGVSDRIYKEFKGSAPFSGYFQFTRPSIIPTDLELIKNILVKDFNKFPNRGLYYNERDDPLSAHLFVLEDEKWKNLRIKLTPTFSSGKMKLMFSTMMGIGECLVEAISEDIRDNPKVIMKDLLWKFTTDIIGQCAFGIECNTLKNQNTVFHEMAIKSINTNVVKPLKLFSQNFPELARFMHCKRFPTDLTSFFFNIVKRNVTIRQSETTGRKDFMDILLDLLRNNTLSLEEIAAQSFLFFLAGLQTSSTTMDFAIYELACNQTIQDKLRQEINDVIDKHKGELTYEGVSEMTYLKKVVGETLRKNPVAIQLRRIAATDYPTSDTRYIIPKGTLVTIPVFSIHHDPEYYPDPEVFNPERFSPDEIEKRHPMAFLPFGEGPRICIATRFATMQVNVGLIMLIRKFKFSITRETLMPLEYNKTTSTLYPARPIILKVELV